MFNLKCFARCQLRLRLFASNKSVERAHGGLALPVSSSWFRCPKSIGNNQFALETFNEKCLVSGFLGPRCTLHPGDGHLLAPYCKLQSRMVKFESWKLLSISMLCRPNDADTYLRTLPFASHEACVCHPSFVVLMRRPSKQVLHCSRKVDGNNNNSKTICTRFSCL